MRGHLLPLYYQLSSQQKRSRSWRRINRHVSSISSVQISSANRWTNYLCLHRPSKPQRKKTDLGKHSKLTPNSSSTIYMAKVYRYWGEMKGWKRSEICSDPCNIYTHLWQGFSYVPSHSFPHQGLWKEH